MADSENTRNGDGEDMDGVLCASLSDLLDAKLEQLGYKAKVDGVFSNMNVQLKNQESKAQEIDKIFEDCEEQLRRIREELDKESDTEPELVESGSDSGDDVQFIETTYTPASLKKPMTPVTPVLAQSNANIRLPPAPANTHMIMRAMTPGGVMQPAIRMGGGFTPFSPRVMTTHDRLVNNPTLGVLRPNFTYQAPQMPKQLDLAVGMKLFGKKSNDIWYKGTLVEIHNKDKPSNEKKYKLKFDCKGMKVLSGMHLAYCDEPTTVLPVGSRVIAMYKEEDSSTKAFYAGIVAESPSVRNNQRYLVFFDDGYAQYGIFKEIRKVYEQSKNVWEDIHPDSQEFIKSYLKQYPERPMVRLQKGQVVKTEWNGKWWTAKVEEVDASLVKMYFDADNRNEWIYRGSTRLEPLYTELANAEASKVSGKGRRHNVNMKSNRKPYVEYTRGHEEESHRARAGQQLNAEQQYPNMMKLIGTTDQGITTAPGASAPLLPRAPTPAYGGTAHSQPITSPVDNKKRSVARKSTAMRSEPEKHLHLQKLTEPLTPPIENDKRKGPTLGNVTNRPSGGKDMASLLQNRLSSSEYTDVDEEALGERMEINRNLPPENYKPRTYKRHRCNKNCIKEKDDPTKWLGCNPLIIPMKCGWERQIAKQKNTGRRVVFYRAPCARRLRSMDEVDGYLALTDSLLTVDLFCYDSNLHTHSEFVPIKTFCDIKDLSYGKETVPISCVNGFDRQYPDYVEYSNQRIPAKGVTLNLDTSFLCGCDCTDGCRDPNKCACIQRTIEASQMGIQGFENKTGYEYRRLNEPLITGIYECNPQCNCDRRCENRVAQNGLQLRLQVFKTEKRGWGLRCLDDIPVGGFICIYAGQLLTEQGANEDGQQYGDEYLAELDYIEVVEGAKEGYESDVDHDSDEGIGEEEGDTEEEEAEDQDTDRNKQKSQQSSQSTEEHLKLVLKRQGMVSGRDESWSVKVKTMNSQKKTEDWVRQISFPPAMSSAIVISDSDEETSAAQQDEPSLPQVDGAGDSKSDDEGQGEDTGAGEEVAMEQDLPSQENPEGEGIAKVEDGVEKMVVDKKEKSTDCDSA